jgi:hypothetical protein
METAPCGSKTLPEIVERGNPADPEPDRERTNYQGLACKRRSRPR